MEHQKTGRKGSVAIVADNRVEAEREAEDPASSAAVGDLKLPAHSRKTDNDVFEVNDPVAIGWREKCHGTWNGR